MLGQLKNDRNDSMNNSTKACSLSPTPQNAINKNNNSNSTMRAEFPLSTSKTDTNLNKNAKQAMQNAKLNAGSMSHSASMTYQLNRHSSQPATGSSTHAGHNIFLGTFLKVYNRLKRPLLPGVGQRAKSALVINSTKQFEYISGEQLRAKSQGPPTMLLSDEDFRTSHDKKSINLPTRNHLAADNAKTTSTTKTNSGDLLQISSANNTGSSGVSSSSSMGQLQRSPSPNQLVQEQLMQQHQQPRQAAAEALRFAQASSKRRISAPLPLDQDAPELASRAWHNHTRRQRSFGQYGNNQTLSEEDNEENQGDKLSDMSAEDVYTTPNDSVISLANFKRQPLTKSHSTNNFSQLINKQQQQSRNLRSNIDQTEANQNNKLIKEAASNSRFFISSSSSEDSSAISNEVQKISHKSNDDKRYKESTQQQQKRIPLSLGVHSHSISPPSSLIKTSPQFLVQHEASIAQQQMQNHQWTPLTSPVEAPSDPDANHRTSFFSVSHAASPAFQQRQPLRQMATFYKKSPSLYDFQHQRSARNNKLLANNDAVRMKSGDHKMLARENDDSQSSHLMDMHKKLQQQPRNNIPSSISLYDCQSSMENNSRIDQFQDLKSRDQPSAADYEFKLTQMLLNMGPNLNVKDADGFTALMYATLSDNFASIKCLVENGANINETNRHGLNTLDLLCSKEPSEARLNTLKFFLANGGDRDAISETDGSRLLDRLIRLHQEEGSRARATTVGCRRNNKLPYIDFLLQSGAKLGSSTWHAAYGKHEILLRLLAKLCQDGYYLYKTSSIEAAVYRFEYALKRVVELEYQIMMGLGLGVNSSANVMMPNNSISNNNSVDSIQQSCLQLKYQTYLGLSRCELKRKFFKRALEFAQLAILIDSTAYEAYYSKALILKNMGDFDDALNTTNQSVRLIEMSIDRTRESLGRVKEQEEEAMVIFDANYANYGQLREDVELLRASRRELESMLDYLCEARRFITQLKQDIASELQQKENLSYNEETRFTRQEPRGHQVI